MTDPVVKNSRRTFVKRVGAGVIFSSLPAQSVWGACNASGISGGSRVVAVTCTVPQVDGGWSPGTWQKLTFKASGVSTDTASTFSTIASVDDVKKNNGRGSGSFKKNSTTSIDDSTETTGLQHALHAIKKIFGDAGEATNLRRIKAVAQFMRDTTVVLGDGNTVEMIEFNLEDVFDKTVTGGSLMDLAAMYLNAHYGLSNWDTAINPTADNIMEDFWGSTAVTYALKNNTENRDGTPRFPMPDDLELSDSITTQYWNDNDLSVSHGTF
ncbi:hypothetical protein CW735_13675 [Alteromonas sp. MB-3u-76]|jgi:hypothetical protein|uniref:hypothetical protein n=1 Tax=Alteromonas sp. MB-3u-76 TaxID=2058133 RepID=UPI000C306576|nr:hypothetical protein [Alteromonas sp. MB-3u-76]AUC89098.1 hypothetical protein CW735_13675 [Alteromonas sp. MB-3u-76]